MDRLRASMAETRQRLFLRRLRELNQQQRQLFVDFSDILEPYLDHDEEPAHIHGQRRQTSLLPDESVRQFLDEILSQSRTLDGLGTRMASAATTLPADSRPEPRLNHQQQTQAKTLSTEEILRNIGLQPEDFDKESDRKNVAELWSLYKRETDTNTQRTMWLDQQKDKLVERIQAQNSNSSSSSDNDQDKSELEIPDQLATKMLQLEEQTNQVEAMQTRLDNKWQSFLSGIRNQRELNFTAKMTSVEAKLVQSKQKLFGKNQSQQIREDSAKVIKQREQQVDLLNDVSSAEEDKEALNAEVSSLSTLDAHANEEERKNRAKALVANRIKLKGVMTSASNWVDRHTEDTKRREYELAHDASRDPNTVSTSVAPTQWSKPLQPYQQQQQSRTQSQAQRKQPTPQKSSLDKGSLSLVASNTPNAGSLLTSSAVPQTGQTFVAVSKPPVRSVPVSTSQVELVMSSST